MIRKQVCQLLCCLLLVVAVGFFHWTLTDSTTRNQLNQQLPQTDTQSIAKPIVPYVSATWNVVRSREVAEKMAGKVRVLCWIAMYDKSLAKAKLVRDTWGNRCTKFLLMGDETTKNMDGIISLAVPSGRGHLWTKTKAAFKYIAEKHLGDADWFFKADTDTYVIMENLRFFLSELDVNKTHYIGAKINEIKLIQDYMSGGAGYVLSRKSVEKLVNEGFKLDKCNKGYKEYEDVGMGICMQQLNVTFDEAMDSQDRHRFLPLQPYHHMGDGPKKIWYYKAASNAKEKNMNCCSEFFISFHYVPPEVYWAMEFMLYHAHVFGVSDTYALN